MRVKQSQQRRPLRRKKSNSMKTFTNTLGVWEINEDGSIRLISEAEVPVKESRVKKYANSEKRN